MPAKKTSRAPKKLRQFAAAAAPGLVEFSHASGREFQTSFAADRVDALNGIIHGVGLITSGVKARGHELHVDDTTLTQMLACANKRGKVPVKLNHPSAIENVCGFVTNFSIKGGKLVGDWHLLMEHDEFKTMLERAERMPECFGMSAAFLGDEAVAESGKKLARCEELVAFDCVAQPAAMPSGLFAALVDTGAGAEPNNQQPSNMPKKTTLLNDPNIDPNAMPEQMPAWFKPFADQMQAQHEQLQSIGAFHQQQQQQQLVQELLGMSPEDRAGLSDADLQQWGITREEVGEIDALATQMGEGGDGTQGGAQAGTEGAAATGAAAPAGAARSGTVPAGPGQGNTAVAAMQAEIATLKKFVAGIQREKITELEAKRTGEIDFAITTLEEKSQALLIELEAKDAVIRRYEQAGVHIPVSRNLSENLFEAKAGDSNRTEFEQLVSARFTELRAGKNLKVKELYALQAQATRETINLHKQSFAEHREVQLGR